MTEDIDDIIKKLWRDGENDDTTCKPQLAKIYDRFDQERTLENTSDKCNSSKSDPLKEISCNLENITKNWEKICSEYNDICSTKLCEYLKYWFYGKIYNNNFTLPNMISLYRDLLSLWRNSSCCEKNSDNRCIKNVIIEFDKELLKNKKELYDFSEYYNSVKNVWGTTKCQNAENLCKYINYVIKLYKKIRQRRHLKYNEKYINEMIILEKALVNGNDANFIKEKCPLVDINAVLNMKNKTLQMSENGEGNIILRENLESRNARKKFNDNVLNGLTEYGKYKKFNIENVEETMKNKCFKDIKKLDIKYNWAKELCGKLATYLVKLHSIDGLEGNNNDRCAYLNYWIFDQIMNITGSDDKNVIDGFVLNELNKVVYQLNNTCFYYFDGNFHEWDEEKYLHDFFKNFNEILDKTQTFNNNSQTYCDYIHHINNIYEKYLDRCCIYFYEDEPLNKCEKYFNCDQAYNPYNIYTKLYCKGDEKPEIFFKKVEQPKPIDYNVKTITKLSAGGSCNKFLCDPYYIFVLGTFMVMGTLLMLLVFNKFTKFRSWTRNKKQRKQHMKNNLKQINKNVPESKAKNKNVNVKTQRIQIAYQAE